MSADRFVIAQDAPKPSVEQLEAQRVIRAAIAAAAFAIQEGSAPSREQSLALTKLEEALMWAGKAVFA